MKLITLKPISQVNGIVNLPGSKSISNRALLLAALAKGTTTLSNLLNSDDVKYMINALKLLGVCCFLSKDNTCCKIVGTNGIFVDTVKNELKIFLGNAGTAVRSLAAVLSVGNNNIVLTGEPRMKKRPIGHLVDALRQGGARIDYLEQKNYPPLRLYGGFIGGNIEIDVSISSQFLTALLIMAPLAQKDTLITIKGKLVSKPYIDMTLHLIKKIFGVQVKNQSYRQFIIRGKQQYRAYKHYCIEGDASSASYFLAAGAIKGGIVKVTGISRNSIQGDIRFVEILEKMGANITWNNTSITCTPGRELNAIDMDMNHIPDVAMTIAVTALFAKGTTTLRNIHHWRFKETDRLLAMSTELRKVGANVEEGKDYIRINLPTKIQSASINTYNDHRIAMCFSLVALSDMPISILNPKCTSKTFPNYFNYLADISVPY